MHPGHHGGAGLVGDRALVVHVGVLEVGPVVAVAELHRPRRVGVLGGGLRRGRLRLGLGAPEHVALHALLGLGGVELRDAGLLGVVEGAHRALHARVVLLGEPLEHDAQHLDHRRPRAQPGHRGLDAVVFDDLAFTVLEPPEAERELVHGLA
ncbi:MAG: hypothetical protein IPJ34_41485 [Myxococcales bacterium]|nr:hypothetical protein [Myxococcales bacterium]